MNGTMGLPARAGALAALAVAVSALTMLPEHAAAQGTAAQQSAVRHHCRADFTKFCPGTPANQAMLCLEANLDDLSRNCGKALRLALGEVEPAEAAPQRGASTQELPVASDEPARAAARSRRGIDQPPAASDEPPQNEPPLPRGASRDQDDVPLPRGAAREEIVPDGRDEVVTRRARQAPLPRGTREEVVTRGTRKEVLPRGEREEVPPRGASREEVLPPQDAPPRRARANSAPPEPAAIGRRAGRAPAPQIERGPVQRVERGPVRSAERAPVQRNERVSRVRDPLANACSRELSRYCPDTRAKRTLACLTKHSKTLSPRCWDVYTAAKFARNRR
jgi:hypothetical protein